MRSLLLSLASLLILPSLIEAQGTLIPRPCALRPCLIDRPCIPCPEQNASIFKQSSHVKADLVDRVLRYEVTETFVNRGGRVGEADYIFPLPKGAAFQDLKLSINGELISGETMNASQARAIYEDIVRRQRDPALVEWMGYGMLRARIFPIAPGEEKKVVVRFQMVAEREGDALRVDYFQGKESQQNWLAFAGDRDDADAPRASFTLSYPNNQMYGSPYSPTHSLRTSTHGGRREVTAEGRASEVTLLIPIRKSKDASISVLTYAPRNEDGFALITVSPPAIATRITPRDVTLVLDVSGSMSGVKIQQARDAGKQVLATLGPTDRFKLIDFSTEVRSFRDEFIRATRDNVNAGVKYLESLDASGSTNISGALDAALEDDVQSGRLGLVLFVTDGQPTIGERNPESIADRVNRRRGERRIFSFGVGADINAALVERLAVEGKGTAQFVRPDESVERAVSIVASRLTNPVVTNVRVSADGVKLIKRHPSAETDIFAGQDYVLLTRYDGSGSGRIHFNGQTVNGPVSWTSRVEFPASSRDNPYIARLWATQRIGYLSAEKRKGGDTREIDSEIKQLGEKYAIPTEFTSYLVLEPGMRRDVRPQVRGGSALNAAPMKVIDAPVSVSAAAASRAPEFEAARDAAKQRSVTSLSAADEMDQLKKENSRRVGGRLFALRGEVWTDLRRAEPAKTVKVKSFSEAYFKLIDAIPELKEVFALGDNVVVTGKEVAIEIGPTGAETLSDSELKRIQSGW